ncbi:MAG: helix-turn-helix transcriptional regulator [Paracoccaceae bacterium]
MIFLRHEFPVNPGRPVAAPGGVTSSVFDAMADWCDALHREVPLQNAFAGLLQALGAEAGMIVRTRLRELRPTRVVTYDRAVSSICPLKSSFADEYFGPHLIKPRAATIWLGSAHADEKCARDAVALHDWQAARRMSELVVLVLSGGPFVRDHVELHFRDALSADTLAALSAVLPTMARTWATRQAGLITGEALTERRAVSDAPRPQLLGVANPARLSRAEFRVCLLLSRGLSVDGVSEELGLSEATIRSHLRSIYAKTGAGSLAELVFQLIQPDRTTSEPLAWIA